ncbi:MAG: Threonine-tRNA ligase [Candidatus Collierbacteria bacterium GW2011_GWA1_42_60]|uniref:Threonine--tRNA ligase n=1 Tax=Candidatus Collierbacteria bacterium GW2011_GWA2_42_17 TaxID=1618378 RepID=A0A0G0Z269_9BACT|nr:MAG: Threonine-tRNA ligase [Candidatus Collierbacteria bacterium GW2011_GWB2_42_12]KKS42880.1 MAG: Threonine-tRNA ligase [Candidatus Collierbacteria bacterium GW2011_GWA2_42_17]KKS62990.1 MAG: Threonine-tRNA ligase [Candidatus Collierbacteria bacterium GW2011_GWE2_42_48]KKS63272.1 MAG: Threonine-tRNA ligase [Candidatus Collierbacteria bacterium GW2011_GWD2_42_50]KKS64458.1 MAG: Threonine-tRNA ligase [Candidatus Collierbacteria bacterium GW2011_GWF2_42_51]KKS67754.1 MAG: Threonine-tRNA ligas
MHALRHSAEHILTQAMERLWPGQIIKAMGPAIETGFYFDFDTTNGIKIAETDFPKIEKEMRKIVQSNLPFEKMIVTAKKAREMFEDNPYKQEWIDKAESEKEEISVYWTGDPGKGGSFVDVCAGPHVARTIEVKAFKLLSIAGAYWHGDEKNKMLTRIYGTAFETQEELDKYVTLLEEAKKRDHRKLGKELDLFSFSDLVGSGLPLYSPKGSFIRRMLNDYVEEMQYKEGYTQVWTPQIAKAELFKTSGHYDKYKDSMFRVVSNFSEEEMFLKPMNCPQHTQIFAAQARSYRDLPIRLTDFAMLYRDEKPGELSGLARTRGFSQDDCHIFCREDQVDAEIDMALQMTKKIMATFGFKYKYRLSTRDPQHPEKYLGEPKVWDKVEKWAEAIMERNGIEYFQGPGEAAFYAPKMDLIATDALGREWQLSTVQIDYVMPERFNLVYTDQDGTQKHPIMLHRAIIGSAERMMMILLEHFGGAFPLWLSPVQVSILPISEKTMEYAESVLKNLQKKGVRVELNRDADSLGKKIRNAESAKVPYMLIIGEKEAEAKEVSVRQRGQKDLGTMTVDSFTDRVIKEIEEKSL